jgi:hypothetical protein
MSKIKPNKAKVKVGGPSPRGFILKPKKGGAGTSKEKKALRKASKAHMRTIRRLGGNASRGHRYKQRRVKL